MPETQNVVHFPGLINRIINHLYKCNIDQIDVQKVDGGIRFVCMASGKRASGTLRHGQSLSGFVKSIIDLLSIVGADVEYRDAK